MKNWLRKFVAMMLAIILLTSTFTTAMAGDGMSAGVVEFDHGLTSTHENDTSLKISWSSTSGNTEYYSVAVKALDGYPQFTADTENGSIIGGYNGTFQTKESITLKTSVLPEPGAWIKVFVKGFASDKTTVTDEGSYVYFLIEEAPEEEEYAELSCSTYSVDAKGIDDVKVTVEANIDWSLDCSTEDWITLSKDSGSGNGKFYFSVDPNTRAVSRSATIWLMDKGRYETYATLKITQEAAEEDPYMTVSPTSIDDDGAGGTYTIAVSSNINWDSYVGKAGKDWITINTENGVGDASIKVTVSANDTGEERTGKILIDSVDGEFINDVFVTQKAIVKPENPTLSGFTVTPSTAKVGDSFSIAGTVNGNGCTITAVSVAVRNANDGSLGGYWGQMSGMSVSSYDLSSMGTLTAGTTIGNTTLSAGTYTVQVYVTTAEGLSFENEYTTTITVTEAKNNPTVMGFKVTPSNAKVSESFSIDGIVKGNGCTITAVSVAVRNTDDSSLGGYWGQKSGLSASNYALSSMGMLTAGDTIGNTTLTEGTYIVQVYVTTAEGLSFENEYTTTITVTEATNNPTVSGFVVTPPIVEPDESFSIAGTVNGNGCTITAVSVAVRNSNDSSLGGYWGQKSELSVSSYDLSSMGTLAAGDTMVFTSLNGQQRSARL